MQCLSGAPGLTDAVVQNYNVVVCVGQTRAEELRINAACRAAGTPIKFIACDARGASVLPRRASRGFRRLSAERLRAARRELQLAH